MISQGSPYTRFRRALDTGNVLLVQAAAADLSRVELGDALRVVEVFAQDEALFARAAVRWRSVFHSLSSQLPRLLETAPA